MPAPTAYIYAIDNLAPNNQWELHACWIAAANVQVDLTDPARRYAQPHLPLSGNWKRRIALDQGVTLASGIIARFSLPPF